MLRPNGLTLTPQGATKRPSGEMMMPLGLIVIPLAAAITAQGRKFTPVMSKATSAAARMQLGLAYMKAPETAIYSDAVTL